MKNLDKNLTFLKTGIQLMHRAILGNKPFDLNLQLMSLFI